MLGRIYYVICTITNKWYFGQTVKTVEKRWKEHIGSAQRGSDHKFHRAIRKYGEENFTVEEVMWVKAPTKKELKAKLDFLERHFIQRYDTKRNGYNSTDGGDGFKNMLEESLLKISNALKGRVFTEITRKKISTANKGRTLNKTWIERIRKANTGKKRSLVSKKKYSLSKMGQRNPSFGKKMPLELKEKLIRINTGKPKSEATKRKMSASMKRRWELKKRLL